MKKEVLFNKIKSIFNPISSIHSAKQEEPVINTKIIEDTQPIKTKNEEIIKNNIDENSEDDALLAFGFIGGLFLAIFVGSWAWHFIKS